MLVKICGITTAEAANSAVEGGTDFIGFIFAKSKRRIAPKEAAVLASSIPPSVKKVGVFVNETIENMQEIAEMVGLDVIQLHGDEPREVAEQLPYEIIKAFPAEKKSFYKMKDYPCDYILIDSPSEKTRGGSGVVFDWNVLDGLDLGHRKLMLAGGLTPENVRTAIEKIHPVAVDVSSGVETDGRKDGMKIKQFIMHAKEARKDEME